MNRILFVFMTYFVLLQTAAKAADYQIIDINPGQTVDVYFEINLSGSVFVRIESIEGPGCADFWWITWPFGTIKSLGKNCGAAHFELPGISNFAISAKLRAGGVSRHTKVIAAASEAVTNSVTVKW